MSKGDMWTHEFFEYPNDVGYMTEFNPDKTEWRVWREEDGKTKYMGCVYCEFRGEFTIENAVGEAFDTFYSEDIIERPNEWAVMVLHEESL